MREVGWINTIAELVRVFGEVPSLKCLRLDWQSPTCIGKIIPTNKEVMIVRLIGKYAENFVVIAILSVVCFCVLQRVPLLLAQHR